MIPSVATHYDGAFFDAIADGSLRSARIVAQLLLELFTPHSVVDVGCGTGAWLKAFAERVDGLEVMGIDGDYVDRSKLLFDQNRFVAADLTRLVRIDGRYDLALCLEVAEHLPSPSASGLVSALTGCAPLVLFSAAVPGQTGTHHVNERWPFYWKALFADRGYFRLDPVRRHIWQDERVEWWYQQNIFLFANQQALDHSAALATEYRKAQANCLELVNETILSRYTSFGRLLAKLPVAAWQAVRRRLRP
jgi:SAM-dependent methyltransferase